jgi:hypothetical protein
MITVTAAVFTRDHFAEPVRICIMHPDHKQGEIVIRRTIDWANETPAKVAAEYVLQTFNVDSYHGEILEFETSRGETTLSVYQLDFDGPSPATVQDAKTIQTYAVPDNAGSLMLAMSIIDAHGRLVEMVAKREHEAEWHVTCIGPAKLHSDMLGHFEWTGPKS